MFSELNPWDTTPFATESERKINIHTLSNETMDNTSSTVEASGNDTVSHDPESYIPAVIGIQPDPSQGLLSDIPRLPIDANNTDTSLFLPDLELNHHKISMNGPQVYENDPPFHYDSMNQDIQRDYSGYALPILNLEIPCIQGDSCILGHYGGFTHNQEWHAYRDAWNQYWSKQSDFYLDTHDESEFYLKILRFSGLLHWCMAQCESEQQRAYFKQILTDPSLHDEQGIEDNKHQIYKMSAQCLVNHVVDYPAVAIPPNTAALAEKSSTDVVTDRDLFEELMEQCVSKNICVGNGIISNQKPSDQVSKSAHHSQKKSSPHTTKNNSAENTIERTTKKIKISSESSQSTPQKIISSLKKSIENSAAREKPQKEHAPQTSIEGKLTDKRNKDRVNAARMRERNQMARNQLAREWNQAYNHTHPYHIKSNLNEVLDLDICQNFIKRKGGLEKLALSITQKKPTR